MRKILLGFLLIIFFWQTSFAADNDPVEMLRAVTKTSIDQLTAYKSQHPDAKTVPFTVVYTIVEKQLLPHVAIDYMLKSILARQCQYQNGTCVLLDLKTVPQSQWADLRSEFIYMMVGLYSSALSEADKYRILFRKNRVAVEAKPGAMLEVESQVVMPNTDPVRITYQMIYENNQWLVYDFSINGAISVVNNLRAQFSPTIQQEGLPGLLTMLKEHNASLAKK